MSDVVCPNALATLSDGSQDSSRFQIYSEEAKNTVLIRIVCMRSPSSSAAKGDIGKHQLLTCATLRFEPDLMDVGLYC